MKIALHSKIFIGLFLGLILGIICKEYGQKQIIIDWIKPFGIIFLNLLKMIAVPLIIVSLITGLSDLKDISKLSKLGTTTISFYFFTTTISVTLGLILANIIQPGNFINEHSRNTLLQQFEHNTKKKIQIANQQKNKSPLQPLIDIVPENAFQAMTKNENMLQVIIFSILISIGIICIDNKKSQPIIKFFKSFNDVILKVVDLIMVISPIGVFSLMSSLLIEIPDFSTLKALIIYSCTVLLGLFLLISIFYPILLYFIAKINPIKFYQKMTSAQLLAFSTSSSAAALPMTVECVVEKLKVKEEIAGFILPLGATINMDGTSLYQAVATIFIAQTFGIDLNIQQQIMIVVTATLASIGSAAIPSAGMVMLVIVLGQAGIPEAGLALIYAIDRPLDMFRTSVNVTSDATICLIMNRLLKSKNE